MIMGGGWGRMDRPGHVPALGTIMKQILSSGAPAGAIMKQILSSGPPAGTIMQQILSSGLPAGAIMKQILSSGPPAGGIMKRGQLRSSRWAPVVWSYCVPASICLAADSNTSFALGGYLSADSCTLSLVPPLPPIQC